MKFKDKDKVYKRHEYDRILLVKEDDMNQILDKFNSFDNIKFTMDHFEDNYVCFLYITNDQADTDLPYKLRNIKQYSNFNRSML